MICNSQYIYIEYTSSTSSVFINSTYNQPVIYEYSLIFFFNENVSYEKRFVIEIILFTCFLEVKKKYVSVKMAYQYIDKS